MNIFNSKQQLDFQPRNILVEQSKPGKITIGMVTAVIVSMLIGFAGGFSYFSYSVLGVNPFITRQTTQVNSLPVSTLNSANMPKPYAAVVAFLKSDETNEIQYQVGGFDCREYALFTWIHAIAAGFECVPVVVKLDAPTSHMIVAFDTTDRGIVFIEPQEDQEVFPDTWKKWEGTTILGLYYLGMSLDPVMDSYPPYS